MIETQRVRSEFQGDFSSGLHVALLEQQLIGRMDMRLSTPVLIALLAAGCTTTLPADHALVDPYVPVVPEVPTSPRMVTGSIFMDQNGSRLFGHKRDFSVGDVVTVVLTESTQAQRRSGLEASKEAIMQR